MNTAKESNDKKIAVLLLAFGGPSAFEEVEPFIKNVTGGRLPADKIQEVIKRYEKIGGSSPLFEITKKQAAALEDSLNKKEKRFSVFVGMRYWHPFISDTIKQIISENTEKIIAVPMTPYYSRVSTEGYINDFIKGLPRDGNKIEYAFIKNFNSHPLFIKAFSGLIIREKNNFRGKNPEIIFSAHSIPKKFIDEGDPYLSQIKETADAVSNNAGLAGYHLAFQSKSAAPLEWLGPDVSFVLEKIKNSGGKDVLLVPLGFISDHIETLYDIDVIYKNEAAALGLNFRRAPSLNTNPDFIESLKDLIENNIKGE